MVTILSVFSASGESSAVYSLFAENNTVKRRRSCTRVRLRRIAFRSQISQGELLLPLREDRLLDDEDALVRRNGVKIEKRRKTCRDRAGNPDNRALGFKDSF